MHYPRFARCWCRIALPGLLALPAGLPGAVAPEKPGEVVQMPEFLVHEKIVLRPLEHDWRYGRIGEFEILSNASERTTRDLATRLYDFHRVFTWMIPQMNFASHRPVTLVLCGARDVFEQFRPPGEDSPDRTAASLYVRDDDMAAIVVDLQAETVNVTETHGLTRADAGGQVAIDPGLPVDRNRVLYREYVHFVLSQFQSRGPAWLEEGLAQLISIMDIGDKNIRFASLPTETVTSMQTLRTGDADTKVQVPLSSNDVPELSLFFTRRAFMPFAQFFAIGFDAPEYRNPIGSTFSMQALAFVHLCLYGEKGKYQKALYTFANRASHATPTEAMFKECFGMDYKHMELELRSYLDSGRYQRAVVKAGALPPRPALELRMAEDAEVGRIKGDTLRLAKRYDDARAELLSALVRGHTEARLFASLGLLSQVDGQTDPAERFFARAVQEKVSLPGPYVQLARLRLDRALAAAGPDGRLPAAEMMTILQPLFAALQNSPWPRPDIYLAIADAWQLSAQPPTAGNLAVLDQGVRQFPQRTDLIYKDAALKAKHGFPGDAAALVAMGLKVAHDPETKRRFEQLQATLPADATTGKH